MQEQVKPWLILMGRPSFIKISIFRLILKSTRNIYLDLGRGCRSLSWRMGRTRCGPKEMRKHKLIRVVVALSFRECTLFVWLRRRIPMIIWVCILGVRMRRHPSFKPMALKEFWVTSQLVATLTLTFSSAAQLRTWSQATKSSLAFHHYHPSGRSAGTPLATK